MFRVGERVGELTIIRFHETDYRGNIWELECDCGRHAYRSASALLSAQRHHRKPCCQMCHQELWSGINEDWRQKRRQSRLKGSLGSFDQYGSIWPWGTEESLTEQIRDDMAAELGFYPDEEDPLIENTTSYAGARTMSPQDIYFWRPDYRGFTGNVAWHYATVTHAQHRLDQSIAEAKIRDDRFRSKRKQREQEDKLRPPKRQPTKREWFSWLAAAPSAFADEASLVKLHLFQFIDGMSNVCDQSQWEYTARALVRLGTQALCRYNDTTMITQHGSTWVRFTITRNKLGTLVTPQTDQAREFIDTLIQAARRNGAPDSVIECVFQHCSRIAKKGWDRYVYVSRAKVRAAAAKERALKKQNDLFSK